MLFLKLQNWCRSTHKSLIIFNKNISLNLHWLYNFLSLLFYLEDFSFTYFFDVSLILFFCYFPLFYFFRYFFFNIIGLMISVLIILRRTKNSAIPHFIMIYTKLGGNIILINNHIEFIGVKQTGQDIFFLIHLFKHKLWNKCIQAIFAIFWPSDIFLKHIEHIYFYSTAISNGNFSLFALT